MLSGFHSVDLAVPDLARALRFYRDMLGLEQITGPITSRRGHDLRWVGLGLASTPFLSLLEPTGPGPLQRFLDHQGPGVFQVCLDSPDPRAVAARLARHGIEVVEEDRPSGSVYVHPRDAEGVLVEVMPS